MLKEFKEFINKGDIVTIAVGLILALALFSVVESLIADIITPIIAAIFGEPDFSALTLDIGDGVITYGNFLNALFAFIVIAFILFLMVKGYNKLTRKQEEDAGPTEVDLLTEIRDSLKR